MLVKQSRCHQHESNGKLHLEGQNDILYLRLHVYFCLLSLMHVEPF